MAKILGIGNALIDIIHRVDHYPQEDEEIRANSQSVRLGGNVANSLQVLAQLGHEPAFLGVIAQDAEGQMVQKLMQEAGIDLSHAQIKRLGQTPRSYITLNIQNGSRTIVHYRQLDELDHQRFGKTPIEDYQWLHFEGRNLDNLTAMINLAPVFLQGQPMSLELEKNRPGLVELMPKVGVAFMAKTFAQTQGFYTPELALAHYHALAPNTLIFLTWGGQGAWLCTQDGKIHHEAAHDDMPLVETLGAGDTFIAAAIHALINQNTPQQALGFANQLAARKCAQEGFANLLAPLPDKNPILMPLSKLSNAKTTILKHPISQKEIFLLKTKDGVVCYENNCPHKQLPLNSVYKIDVNPAEGYLKCSVHEAFFNISDGKCRGGVCERTKLKAVKVFVDEKEQIRLA